MNIDFDIKCTTGGFALEYPTNECLRNIGGGGGGGGTGFTGPPGPIDPPPCAEQPLQIIGNCVEMTPAMLCGAIHQYVNNAWGIYRAPGITEVTVGLPGNNMAPGNNYPTVADAILGAGDTNCLFIRVTNTIAEGAVVAPGGGRPLLIYVDPEVMWICTSINCMNSNLTLIGNSSDTSQFVVTGQITNCSSVTVSDCNLTFQGFVGIGEVHVRNSTLINSINTLATTLSLLEVSDSVISLELVALCLTSTTVVKLTRIDINANLPPGGNPVISGNTGGFIFLNSAFTEINEMTYNGNLGDMVLTNGYMSNISDISPLGPVNDPRNLSIRIGNIGPMYNLLAPDITNQPMREINEFQNGRYIVDESPVYGIDGLFRTWRNLFVRGAQIQWLILPVHNNGNTAVVNCHFNHINVTGPVGSAGVPGGYRPELGAYFVKSSFVDITIPQNTTDAGIPSDTLFITNGGTNNFKITNMECGNMIPVGNEIQITNLKALNFTTGPSSSNFCTYNNMYLRSMGTPFDVGFWANMFNCKVSNVFVEQNAFFVQSSDNVFKNIIFGGTLEIVVSARNSWNNIRCARLWFPGSQLPAQNFSTIYSPASATSGNQTNLLSFDNFSDIVITGDDFDLAASHTKFTNLTCIGSFVISGNYNDVSNVIVQNINQGIAIYGDGNKLKNCRPSFTPVDGYSVLIRGNQNQIADLTVPGTSIAGMTRQAFEVSGCLNKFSNIQIGEMTRIPIASSSGPDPFVFTLNDINPTMTSPTLGHFYQINSPPMMPPATGPAPMTGWQSLFQPGNCFCVGSQLAATGAPVAEFQVLTTLAGVAGKTVITATGPVGYGVGTPGLYVLTPNPLDEGAFGNIDFGASSVDSNLLGGGGLIDFGGSNNHYTNIEIYPKRNTITRSAGPPADFNVFEAHIDVVVSGTFNHFTNLWLYKDPWHYQSFLGYPTGPPPNSYIPPSGGFNFTNQNLYISGDSNTFVNCKVGPGCAIGTSATPGTETFVATGPAINNKIVSSWARSPFTGIGWAPTMVSWSAGINDTFS
jgi:hypothetical protein